jgi:hypothetical protein
MDVRMPATQWDTTSIIIRIHRRSLRRLEKRLSSVHVGWHPFLEHWSWRSPHVVITPKLQSSYTRCIFSKYFWLL